MSKMSSKLVCAGVMVAVGAVASADTVRVTKYVSQYIWDETPVRGVSDSPAGWGGESWQGPVAGPGNKTNFYLTAADMVEAFGGNISIGDIAKISFHTKRDTGDEADDLFFMNVYTEPTGSDDSASWYKSRLLIAPDEGGSQTNDVWQLWSSDNSESSTNQLTFEDTARNGFSGPEGDIGSWTLPGRDYSTEMFSQMAIGTNSGNNGNNTYVDGITFTLFDGSVGEFDMQFTVIPLPTGSALAGLGLLGVAARRRRPEL